MLDKRKFFIGGAWVDPISATDLDVINPATEEVIAVISMGSEADADAAVKAANAAFPGYSKTRKAERLDLLESILAVYKKRYDDMADAITRRDGRALQAFPCGSGWRRGRAFARLYRCAERL